MRQLLPNQGEVHDETLALLERGRSVIITGASGLGKSSIIGALHADPNLQTQLLDPFDAGEWPKPDTEHVRLLDSDTHFAYEIEKARYGFRNVIIAPERTYGEHAITAIERSSDVSTSLRLRRLNKDETTAFAQTLKPEITEEELSLVKKYGLGIPLLIKKMCGDKTLNQRSALEIATMYIVDQYGSVITHGGKLLRREVDKIDTTIRTLMRIWEATPHAIRIDEELGNAIKEHIVISDPYSLRGRIHPQAWTLPHFPPSAELWDKYEKMLEDTMAWIRIVIPDLPEIHRDALFGEDMREDGSGLARGRLRSFGASLMKTAIILPNRCVGEWSYQNQMEMFFQSKALEEAGVKITRGDSTCMVFATAHPPCTYNQAKIGIALESYLQGEGIPYITLDGGRNTLTIFSPEARQ